MRQEGTAGTDATLGELLVGIHDRAFLIGPGSFAGVPNGMILGYLTYRSGSVPRGRAVRACAAPTSAASSAVSNGSVASPARTRWT